MVATNDQRKWSQNYQAEVIEGRQRQPQKDQVLEGKIRRRIEDIKEASRLEEEIFEEVWDKVDKQSSGANVHAPAGESSG